MHLLPASLAKLADSADRKDSPKFALSAVHLMVNPPGDPLAPNTFAAEATDSRQLIRVSGPCVGTPSEYPAHNGLAAAPNGGSEALIAGDTWRRAFAAAAKTAKRGARHKAILGTVAVVVGHDLTTFGATDLESYPTEQTRNMPGRFPPVAAIVKQAKQETRFAFAIDPKALAGVLETMAAIADADGEAGRVEFHLGEPGKPLYLRAVNSDGLTVEAVVVPLKPDVGDGKQAAPVETAAVYSSGRRPDECRRAWRSLMSDEARLAAVLAGAKGNGGAYAALGRAAGGLSAGAVGKYLAADGLRVDRGGRLRRIDPADAGCEKTGAAFARASESGS